MACIQLITYSVTMLLLLLLVVVVVVLLPLIVFGKCRLSGELQT
jgi:hypothetical protein